jgi:hypothetical protein
LKENRYLTYQEVDAPAVASWSKFHRTHTDGYISSAAARELLRLHPKVQVIKSSGLGWEPVDVSNCQTELCRIVWMLNTVRNNLFHGGKHGDCEVDDKDRNLQLLRNGKVVMDELAEMAGFHADYTRNYWSAANENKKLMSGVNGGICECKIWLGSSLSSNSTDEHVPDFGAGPANRQSRSGIVKISFHSMPETWFISG